jgi:hypothetical protein
MITHLACKNVLIISMVLVCRVNAGSYGAAELWCVIAVSAYADGDHYPSGLF